MLTKSPLLFCPFCFVMKENCWACVNLAWEIPLIFIV